MKWFNNLISFFFPEYCYLCKKELKHWQVLFCSDCIEKLPFINKYCKRCGNLLPENIPLSKGSICGTCYNQEIYFDKIKPIFAYKPPISDLIKKAKYEAKFDMAKLIGRFIKRFSLSYLQELNFDYLIPVPMHPKRLILRGYNHALIMAMGIDKNKILLDALHKKRYTVSQTKLSRKERLNNVKNSFAVSDKYKSILKDKKILLFDDVATTCATLNEIAKLLKKLKVKEVFALVIAKN